MIFSLFLMEAVLQALPMLYFPLEKKRSKRQYQGQYIRADFQQGVESVS